MEIFIPGLILNSVYQVEILSPLNCKHLLKMTLQFRVKIYLVEISTWFSKPEMRFQPSMKMFEKKIMWNSDIRENFLIFIFQQFCASIT